VPEAHYKVTIDGEIIEDEALICCILNAGSIGGVMGLELPEVGNVDISDGCLDLYAIKKGRQPLWSVSRHIFNHEGTDMGVYHWQGKEITIESDPVQDVWIDGELGGKTPFTVTALPQALEIVIPT
jgi:diacylglycerol kinase family enzyme